MSVKLQLVFIVATIVTLIYIIRNIRKHGLNIDDALIWIIWSVGLLVISFFPGLPKYISHKLGFMASSNFVFTVLILFLYIVVFFQNIQISRLKEKQKDLIQKLSIKEYREKKEEER